VSLRRAGANTGIMHLQLFILVYFPGLSLFCFPSNFFFFFLLLEAHRHQHHTTQYHTMHIPYFLPALHLPAITHIFGMFSWRENYCKLGPFFFVFFPPSFLLINTMGSRAQTDNISVVRVSSKSEAWPL